MSGTSRLASPGGWKVRAQLVRAVRARVGCLGHEACVAGAFFDNGDVAVSDDDHFRLRDFVAGLDQESVGVSLTLLYRVASTVRFVSQEAAPHSHTMGNWGKTTAALSRPVNPLVDLTQRCLVERNLHETLPVLLIGFSHPDGVPWRSGFKTDASRVVLEGSDERVSEWEKRGGAILERPQDLRPLASIQRDPRKAHVDREAHPHGKLGVPGATQQHGKLCRCA